MCHGPRGQCHRCPGRPNFVQDAKEPQVLLSCGSHFADFPSAEPSAVYCVICFLTSPRGDPCFSSHVSSENLRSNALNAVCNLSLNRKWARVIATQPVIQTTLQSLCRSRDTVECKRSECVLREIKPYLSQQQGQEDNWADVQESKLKFQTFLP